LGIFLASLNIEELVVGAYDYMIIAGDGCDVNWFDEVLVMVTSGNEPAGIPIWVIIVIAVMVGRGVAASVVIYRKRARNANFVSALVFGWVNAVDPLIFKSAIGTGTLILSTFNLLRYVGDNPLAAILLSNLLWELKKEVK
jgi:hypothetical protein